MRDVPGTLRLGNPMATTDKRTLEETTNALSITNKLEKANSGETQTESDSSRTSISSELVQTASESTISSDSSLALDTPKPNNPLGVSVGVKKILDAGKIKKMAASQLLAHLDFAASKDPQDLPKGEWAEQMALLIIDLRPVTDFIKGSLPQSVNLTLPTLVLKRFRRLAVSSFNMANFLGTPEAKKIFEDWQNVILADTDCKLERCVVVLDDSISAANLDTDTWAFLANCAESLVNEFIPKTAPVKPLMFAFAEGGFRAVSADNNVPPPTGSRKQSLINPQDGPSENDLTLTRLPARLKGGPNLPGLSIKKGKLNLAIDTQSPVSQKSKNRFVAPQSPSTPTLTLNTKLQERGGSRLAKTSDITSPVTAIRLNFDKEKEDSPLTSPNDNAQPPEAVSKVTKNIILGSNVVPHAPDAIAQFKALGVTHVLNMAAEVENQQCVKDCPDITLKWLPVHDNTEQDMDGPLKEAIEFIANAIKSNPNAVVFVHCKAGRSRSVSVVIGYLVAGEQYTLKKAYDYVRQCRKNVSPNLGFMAALMKVEKETLGVNSNIH